MPIRLRFSTRGAELPASALAALDRLLAAGVIAEDRDDGTAQWVRIRIASGAADWDMLALARLHRLLDSLCSSGADAPLEHTGLSGEDREGLEALSAELATALEAVAHIGKTVGRHAARGE